MKTSGGTLVSFIEEMLDLAKIEAGRLDLSPRPFALAAFVEEAVELLGPRAQAKGLEICAYVDERLPSRVVGDAARLRQVLFNLVGNAIKFTERGGVSIIVEPGAAPDQITIAVRDTGIGIAPEDKSRIFLEFEQADIGSTRKFGGIGLGLTISKRIVERMARLDRDRGHARRRLDISRQRAAAALPTTPTRRRSPSPILPATIFSSSRRPRSKPRCWRGGCSAGARAPPSFPTKRSPRRCFRSSRGAPCSSIMRSAARRARRWRAWPPPSRGGSSW